MTIKADILELALRIHKLSWTIRVTAQERIDEDVFNEWIGYIRELRGELEAIRSRAETAPARVKYHLFTEAQMREQPFYWFVWTVGDTRISGADFERHPFIGIEVVSAPAIIESMLLTLGRIANERFIKVVEVAQVFIGEFVFTVAKKWERKLLVETPIEWGEDWQRGDLDYSVKHRSIMFLETFRIASKYFAGFKWVRYSADQIAAGARGSAGRMLVYDPRGRIDVGEMRRTRSRRFWVVDFSGFDLPKEIDIDEFVRIVKAKNYVVRVGEAKA